jgi:hypothetical protein
MMESILKLIEILLHCGTIARLSRIQTGPFAAAGPEQEFQCPPPPKRYTHLPKP